MEFYNLKTRQKVDIPESALRKSTLVQKNGKHTYAVTGEENGTKLFRFISKRQYDALQVPETRRLLRRRHVVVQASGTPPDFP